jgi:hypothetical protein
MTGNEVPMNTSVPDADAIEMAEDALRMHDEGDYDDASDWADVLAIRLRALLDEHARVVNYYAGHTARTQIDRDEARDEAARLRALLGEPVPGDDAERLLCDGCDGPPHHRECTFVGREYSEPVT